MVVRLRRSRIERSAFKVPGSKFKGLSVSGLRRFRVPELNVSRSMDSRFCVQRVRSATGRVPNISGSLI